MTIEFKGTPGPWLVEEDDEEWGVYRLLQFKPLHAELSHEEKAVASAADARLIAAAPALLEAVETFIRYLDEAIPSHDEVEAKARAAIAQALGEQP